MFPSSLSSYHSQFQTNGSSSGIGLRPLNSTSVVSGMRSYYQMTQQYQQHQSHSQFLLQQTSVVSQSYKDQGMKSLKTSQAAPDQYGRDQGMKSLQTSQAALDQYGRDQGIKPLQASQVTPYLHGRDEGMNPLQTSQAAPDQHVRDQGMKPLQTSQAALDQYERDQGMKSLQTSQAAPDPYGMLGLLDVIRVTGSHRSSLAYGMDLTTLGLDLTSSENLYQSFACPWTDEPAKGHPEFTVPLCYNAEQAPPLNGSNAGLVGLRNWNHL